jgi:phosphatidylserine decarboxylase
MLDYIKQNIIPYKVTLVVGGLLLLLLISSPTILSVSLFLLLAAIHRFYRSPQRVCPSVKGVVYAPCDGLVKKVYEKDGQMHILVYMDLRDCHIQRVPIEGAVQSVVHKPGQYWWAWHPKMAGYNEQNTTTFETPYGSASLTQIAGKLARRIECWVKPGQAVSAGDKLGMIHFSSACQLTLPLTANIETKNGDRIFAGITQIATFNS